MHTFELHLSVEEAVFKEFKDSSQPVREERASREGFLGGELHELVIANMNDAVLPQALESARLLQPVKTTGPLRNAYMAPILAGGEKIVGEIRAALGGLSLDQLNWKPDPQTWSVGECIDHLITSNRLYFAQIEAIGRGDKHVTFWEKLPILHGFWGRMLIKVTSPDNPKKGKTRPVFEPSRSKVPLSVFDEFAQQQRQLMDIVRRTDGVDHHEVMVTSPAGGFITYSLHDAILILFQHERRHFNQALALMKRPEFPKS